MRIEKTGLDGVLLIIPDVYKDDRGYFLESYNEKKYNSLGIPNKFLQDNISASVKGTIRGLHYQVGEYAQGKLCEVTYGKVLDVAVDLRKNSPTFGKYASAVLSDENNHQLWIPVGFAHGFSVLSDKAVFHYKCTQLFSKEHECSIYYADPDININWQISNPIISAKDLVAVKFKDINNNIF